MQLLDHQLPPPALFALFGGMASGRGNDPKRGAGGNRPGEARTDRFFLHVRSVSADGFAHLFQFALVDDFGNVAVSVFVRGRSPVEGDQAVEGRDDGPPPPMPAITWDQLGEALKPCRGAWVVAFGRVLHGSFLPEAIRAEIASLDCARARFIKAARRRGIHVGAGDLSDLNDARRLIGLPPVRSPDAALRAMGLRELWRWMDAVEDLGG